MSNFPYNSQRFTRSDEYNGSPLNYSEAYDLAYKIHDWHYYLDTSDWTQSSSGAEMDIKHLTWGLAELLSDPAAIKRIIMTGKNVMESAKVLTEVGADTQLAGDAYEKMCEFLGIEPQPRTKEKKARIDPLDFAA